METTIIKLSGKVIDSIASNLEFIETIKSIKKTYGAPILVHGAGTEITKWSKMLGINSSYHNGHRITDDFTMEVVAAVQGGIVNTRIVSMLQTTGIEAVGLSGVDRGFLKANYLDKNIGYVGDPYVSGSVEWIHNICRENTIPVFSSICKDDKGNLMNVNADLFAQTLASAMNSKTVFFLSDVKGLKLQGAIQQMVSINEIKIGIKNGDITDGMIPKALSCSELIAKGTDKVWIGTMDDFIGLNKKNISGESYGTWIVDSRKIAS